MTEVKSRNLKNGDEMFNSAEATEVTDGRYSEEECKEEEDDMESGAVNLNMDPLVKNPLQHKWSLWFYKTDRQKTWLDNLKNITGFDTVEDFWALFNHISPPSGLPAGCDYCLFKEGVQPMWEDKENKNGGCWRIVVDKSQRSTVLDHYWTEIIMLMIGEGFHDASDEVCGAVVNIRNKGDRLSLWLRNNNHFEQIMEIGRTLKSQLKLNITINYNSHSDEASKQSSTAKALHQL